MASPSPACRARRSRAYRVEPVFRAYSEAHDRKFITRNIPSRIPPGQALLGEEKYVAPKGYSDHYDHMKNWIDAIRTRQPVVEDPVFGFRAAGAALLSNVSYESGKAGPLGCGGNEAGLRRRAHSRFLKGPSGGAIVDKPRIPATGRLCRHSVECRQRVDCRHGFERRTLG